MTDQHTGERWTATVSDKRPFKLIIKSNMHAEPIAEFDRVAWSTAITDIDELRSGVGWPHHKQPEIVAAIAEQERIVALMACAPELLAERDALRELNLELVKALREARDELESICTCNASMAEEVLEGTGVHPWECECPEPWAMDRIAAVNAALKHAEEVLK
jgi:hypothetical protein